MKQTLEFNRVSINGTGTVRARWFAGFPTQRLASGGCRTEPPPAEALVCVIDHDESIRQSLAQLFRSANLMVETLPSASVYLDRAPHPGPSCLVLAARMPGLDGLELQQKIAGRDEQIVFISKYVDMRMCAQAMKAGAVDFLTKPLDEEQLLDAVRLALALSAEVRQRARERGSARARLDTLTPREFEVMQRVIAGMLNKQIAGELGTVEKTIKVHRGRAMQKLGVASVAELVRVAHVAGVAPV
jgi:FixJ family two-component response regulator